MARWVIIPGKRMKRFAVLIVLGVMSLLVCSVLWQGTVATLGQQQERIIAIDAGHGGYDPGAITKQGTYEKTINLAIAKKVEEYLKPAGVKVIMIRNDDEDFVPEGARGRKTRKQLDLNYRIELATSAEAEALVSIHVNAIVGEQKSGAETFYHYKSDLGKQLAENIQQELIKISGMNKRIAKPGDFYIIKNIKMPSVIVEVGYLSNPKEEKKLLQDYYQDQLAKAIAKGIALYLELP